MHSTNRIPLGDDDFPVELPVYPDAKEILPIHSNPYEGGIHGTYSLGFGDSAKFFENKTRPAKKETLKKICSWFTINLFYEHYFF